MAKQATQPQWVTPNGWVVPAGLAMVLWLGSLSEEAGGWIYCSVVRMAVEAISSVIRAGVILAGWQVTQAPVCSHGILEGLVLQIFGTFWPFILKVAGAA